ncbi:MAG: adenosylmethionine decarboxylase [Candidatus Diapherotrites archaeon]|nr:adenosylmethionine decarboxylase [Candidatus Diapherotrites archaeon]
MEDRIVGKHVFGSLYDVIERAYHDEEWLRSVVEEAARRSGATIIESRSWTIEGPKGGVSVIVLVDESHLAVHTWKEYRYATVDIYTCGEHTDPWKGWEYILSQLKPRKFSVHFADRSQL